MPSPSVLFAFLATCMGYVSLVLLAICIACGLYCASELAEEYSSLALRVVKVAFATVLGLHAVMLVAGVDLFTIAVSVGCHVCYASLLAKFPVSRSAAWARRWLHFVLYYTRRLRGLQTGF